MGIGNTSTSRSTSRSMTQDDDVRWSHWSGGGRGSGVRARARVRAGIELATFAFPIARAHPGRGDHHPYFHQENAFSLEIIATDCALSGRSKMGTFAGWLAADVWALKLGWNAGCGDQFWTRQCARLAAGHFSIHIERCQLVRYETLVNAFSCLYLRSSENKKISQG
jgi:hypothetical protein